MWLCPDVSYAMPSSSKKQKKDCNCCHWPVQYCYFCAFLATFFFCQFLNNQCDKHKDSQMSAIPEGRWLKQPKWAEGMYEEVEKPE